MESLTLMRTILLLNTTQHKLSYEENIFDSANPLRALQLHRLAGKLNTHLHEEQVTYSTPTSNYKEADYRLMAAGLDDDDYDESYEAYEVGQFAADDHDDSVVELEDESDSEVAVSAPSDTDIYSSANPPLFFDAEFDTDATYSDFDEELPALSRQSSFEATDSDVDFEESHGRTAFKVQVNEVPPIQPVKTTSRRCSDNISTMISMQPAMVIA